MWARGFLNAAALSWVLPSSANEGDRTPWEVVTGDKPDVSMHRAFGCTVFSYIDLPERKKLHNSIASPKLLPAVEVGICCGLVPNAKGWCIYLIDWDKILVRRHWLFDERAFCDSRGRIKGIISGNMSGKVNVAT